MDLQTVRGSGPGGRIVMRDVEAAKAGAGATPGSATLGGGTGTTPPGASGTDFEDRPLSQMRKTVGRKLSETYESVADQMKGYRVMVEAMRIGRDGTK